MDFEKQLMIDRVVGNSKIEGLTTSEENKKMMEMYLEGKLTSEEWKSILIDKHSK